MIPPEMTNIIITKLCNDLIFLDGGLQGSIFDKHIECRSNYRSQKLNGKYYKLNPNDYTNITAVQKIKDIFAYNKSVYWDPDDNGVSLIDERTHNYNLSYTEPFMEMMSAIHLLIQKSFKDYDNKFKIALTKLESFHQKFFQGGFNQQQGYINGIENARILMSSWSVPDLYGDKWLDSQISDENSTFHTLVAECVNRALPNANQAWSWQTDWMMNVIGLLTVSVGRYLLHWQRNGIQMYGWVMDAINWNQDPDPIFEFNIFNLFDIESDNTILVTNNLLRPIGILENLVYEQENQGDINSRTGDYIKFTINDKAEYNEQLFKIGNWLITKNDLNDQPQRWIISESNHNYIKGNIDITADQLSTVILSAVKNSRTTTFFLDQIHELVELDYRGSDVLQPPSGDPRGSQYDLKKYMDYLRELSTGWDGSEYQRFNPRIQVDIINNPDDPYYGWFKDTLRVFQSPGKLITYIFSESDLQEYSVDTKSDDLYSAYRELDAEYMKSLDGEWGFEMNTNDNYSSWNGKISAGQGWWCDTWDRDHYKGEYNNCPSSFTSQLHKRNSFFINPHYARDNLSFKRSRNTNMQDKNLLAQIKYSSSSAPDLSDENKQRTYRDKTIYDERRSYYDSAVKEFDDKVYKGNFNNYKVTLSLIGYYERFGKSDVNVGDSVIININGEFLMSTITKTTKNSSKLLDAKVEIDTNYAPYIGGTSFANNGIESYDIDLENIFGVG